MNLMQLTASACGRMIQNRELSAVELTEEALGAIRKKESAVNAFITTDEC